MERNCSLAVSKFFKEEVVEKAGEAFPLWVIEAVDLGFYIERGELFQKIDKDYFKLEMKDIKPIVHPGSQIEVDSGFTNLAFMIPEGTRKTIRLNYNNFSEGEWLRRAFNLRVMAENLDLYYMISGEFIEVKLFSKFSNS